MNGNAVLQGGSQRLLRENVEAQRDQRKNNFDVLGVEGADAGGIYRCLGVVDTSLDALTPSILKGNVVTPVSEMLMRLRG